ncbi:MAG: hypothetical protein HFH60_06470 [Lachnospiraceae bacterium]|nr:hypothetical protein [Lachnospiraceae bacterium]
MIMKRNKALLFMCCAVLTVGSVPVQGARIAKPTVSQNGQKSVAAAVFGSTTQALDLIDLAQEERIERIGEMCRLDYARSGVLASVTAAQCILESGYLTSTLASEANNCFGMKAMLSNNDWENSSWDGSSVYSKETREEYGGQVVTITADFRQYNSVEESLADHSAYLLGAKSGDGLRYEGLKGEADYQQAIQIIKDGGYATDSSYVDKVCAIIERHDLTRFDDVEGVEEEEQSQVKASIESPVKKSSASKGGAGGLSYRDGYYRVRKSWTDIDDQLGAFSVLENAKSVCKPGYNVYDSKGNVVYTQP